MSDILKVRNFGTGGINTDLSPWDLEPNFLTAGNNFRVAAGRVEAFGGYRNLTNVTPAVVPEFLYYINADDEYWAVFGSNLVYIYDGTSWHEITGPAMSVRGELWTGVNLGRVPVFNNPDDHPRHWAPQNTGQALQYLPFDADNTWEDKGFRCRSMRSFRSYLIALNMTEGSDEYTDVVRWSHPADSGGLPTSWDDADPATLANKVALGGDGGAIIDGRPLRDAFVIYRERGISVMDYTGGSYTFRIRHLTTSQACLNPNSLVEVKGLHYFISDGDIVRTDGGNVSSIIHNRFREGFRSRFNNAARETALAVHHRAAKEIWFCVPEGQSERPNVAYIFNYRDETWSVRDLPQLVYADYGQLASAQETWESGTPLDTWANDTKLWSDGATTAYDDRLLGIIQGDPGEIIYLDQETSEVEYETVIERTDYPILGAGAVAAVQAVYPFIEGSLPVQLQIGSQQHPGGPVTWKPPQWFQPGAQRKLDLRVTGELLAFRVKASVAFGLAGLDIQYVPAGQR